MICKFGEAVQWRDGDAELTGVPVLAQDENHLRYITYDGGGEIKPAWNQLVLVAHSYTRELEFVEFSKLSKYPASPIPNP